MTRCTTNLLSTPHKLGAAMLLLATAQMLAVSTASASQPMAVADAAVTTEPAIQQAEGAKPAVASYTVSDMIVEIRQGNCSKLSSMLKSGVSPNQFDAFGYTPLTVAALEKSPQCIKLLTDAGADINLASAGGWTPLIGAAMSGAGEGVMALLLTKGADINAHNQWGCTALYYAAGFGALGTVNYLLDNGAVYPGTSGECMTPMKIVEFRGYPKLVTRFKQLEATLAKTGPAKPGAIMPADKAAVQTGK